MKKNIKKVSGPRWECNIRWFIRFAKFHGCLATFVFLGEAFASMMFIYPYKPFQQRKSMKKKVFPLQTQKLGFSHMFLVNFKSQKSGKKKSFRNFWQGNHVPNQESDAMPPLTQIQMEKIYAHRGIIYGIRYINTYIRWGFIHYIRFSKALVTGVTSDDASHSKYPLLANP